MRVCSRHFHSGKPAYEMLESDPDWVPSLQLGHGEGNGRRTERLLLSGQPERDQNLRLTAKTRPSCESRTPPRESEGGPAVRPWRDVKSLLQSVLRCRNFNQQQLGDETHQQPLAVRKTDLSFRDFFRDALEASLEASSRSRTLSVRQPSISGDYKVELDFKLPPVKEEEDQTCEESSSCCLNCVRLQRRIMELQEELTRLNKPQPDQDLQSPETAHIEEAEPAWMEPLSLSQACLHEGDQDVDPADEATPTGLTVSQDNSSRQQKRYASPRFRAIWLKTFWFLRYSQTLDQMWCHVCRLHADKSHQNLALIKGSRMFKIHNIKKHSNSKYHQDSLERYTLQVCDLKP